jgi:hypothetical protein
MKRIVTAALAPTLITGFLLVDVVSLPGGPQPVDPSVRSIELSESSWRPVTAAHASLMAGAASGPGDVAAPPVTPEPIEVADLADSGGAPDEQPAAETPAEPTDEASAEPTAELTAEPTPGPTGVVPEAGTADDGTTLITSPIETEEFTIAGLTWDSGDADPEGLRVRVREAGTWTAWQTLEPNDEGPDPGTEEYELASAVTGTDPLVSSGADAIQVSVETPAAEVSPSLEVVVIDPGTSSSDETLVESTPLSSASASTAQPAIVSRAAWGANESLRRCSPSYSSTIKAATVHHTAGGNSYSSSQSAGIVRGIYAYHTTSLGWCDVGYNFLVDKYGTVFEGRYGGIDKAVRGAHAGGFNNQTFGVAAMGNYETASAPSAMVNSIARVIGWKLNRYGANPRGTTTLTSAGGTSKYPSGKVVTLPVVFAHRDVGYTACPGRYLNAQMTTIRNEANTLTQHGWYVRSLYLDMLSRTPAGSEVDFWIPIARADRWRAANGFTNSEEYRRKYISAAYRDVLGRNADSEGMKFWLSRLSNKQVVLDDIRPTFMNSREFYMRGGGTDAGFVQLLYSRALGRSASASEESFWVDRLRSSGQQSVIAAIYGSPESARIRVDRAYREWLRRSASTTERAYWEKTVLTRGDEYMRMSVMVSQEYFLKAQTR